MAGRFLSHDSRWLSLPSASSERLPVVCEPPPSCASALTSNLCCFCVCAIDQSMRRTEGKRFACFAVAASCHFAWSPPPPSRLPSSSPFSSPLAWAVLLYLRHSGIKLRDSKVFLGLSTEKEKWLAFLKTKKVRRKENPARRLCCRWLTVQLWT